MTDLHISPITEERIGREAGPEGVANYYQLKSVSLPPGINLNPS
jgi:hypothetical protein